jgi:hypothetical protein
MVTSLQIELSAQLTTTQQIITIYKMFFFHINY